MVVEREEHVFLIKIPVDLLGLIRRQSEIEGL